MSSVTYASFPRKKKGEENPTHMHGKGRPLVLVLTSLCKSTVHGNTFCRSSNKKVPPMQRWLLVVLLAFVTVAVTGMPYQVPMQGVAGGKRTLVLVDDMGLINSHSIFFDSLKSRGHALNYVQAESPELALKKFGDYLYDNIIFFAPTVEDLNTISFEDILEFAGNGGNLLLAVDGQMSSAVREFAESCGIEFDARGSAVIDHFQHIPSVDTSLQSLGVLSSTFLPSHPILGEYAASKSAAMPVLFRGVGHAVDDNNVLAVKVLRGNPSTYSAHPSKPIDDYPENSGADTLLVTALQARNNARVVATGSLDMFSNAFFRSKQSSGELVGNELFCRELSKWAFGEAGILRFRDIVHHKLDGSPPDVILHERERPDLPQSLYPDPEITRNSLVYRIKDDIIYSMIVEQLVDGDKWVPFVAHDMQMEFVMMDPYVRKTMTPNAATGQYVASFVAPDNYGIFKFRVLYRRVGYSVLHAETSVSIRPFKHNEYERFIFSAYPYYSSAFSAMIGFFVFSLFFLYSDEKVTTAKR